jgi:ParB-like chromosome segregation protein Spo0J
MISLPLHPITEDYDNLTDAEAAVMRQSLQENGLANPIVTWQGQIVDGRHRAMFCEELGIEPHYVDISDRCTTEESMRKYVAALNQHRRARTTPLTNEEKRARVTAEVKADPTRSDRAIAKVAGVDHKTVAEGRAKLESRGEIPHAEKRMDASGRKQPAKKSKLRQPTKKRTPSASAPAPKPTTHHDLRNCWDRAPPDERRRFIDGVSLLTLFDAAPIANQEAFRKRLMQ